MVEVFIGVGSNVDPVHNIRSSIGHLREALSNVKCSPVYRNPATGFSGDEFFNLVVGTETSLTIPALKALLREIEYAQGRHRGEAKFAARTIDLDLLTYGDTVISTPTDNLPRTDILEYAFVLRPLAELAPSARHPALDITYQELWAKFAGERSNLNLVPNVFNAPN